MIGDLFYRLGTVAGTGLGVIERALPAPTSLAPANTANPDDDPAEGDGDAHRSGDSAATNDPDDSDLLVDSLLGAAAGWLVKTALRPRPVSWPRVLVAGVSATVLADVVGRSFGAPSEDRDRAYGDDSDAFLVRLGAGVAMAAGYAAILYPRLPGSPLARGLIFGAMELAAAPHGGLVRVATDTPGLKFPLQDLAVPIDEDAGPLAHLAFGLGLGLLYRPALDE